MLNPVHSAPSFYSIMTHWCQELQRRSFFSFYKKYPRDFSCVYSREWIQIHNENSFGPVPYFEEFIGNNNSI